MAYRLAVATAAATFVLILFGGLVTNTGAALAVPDWPTTFGHNMFLYPWSAMVGGVFYEHSHRLLGALVGFLTLALAAVLWRAGRPLRDLGLVAVGAVIAQGVLGGLRVVLLRDTLAIVHGCLAQAFFVLLVTIAFLASPAARVPGAVAAGPPALRALSVLAVALLYLQVIFGALLTHAGRLDLHLAGAVLVFAFVPIVTARARRTGDAVAATAARVVVALLTLQLLLGVGSYLARFSAIALPGEQLTVLILPVAHRLVASLLLAAATVMALRLHVSSAAAPDAVAGSDDVALAPPPLATAARSPRP